MNFEVISGIALAVGVVLGVILHLLTVVFKHHLNIAKWCGLFLVIDGFFVSILFIITLFVVRPF